MRRDLYLFVGLLIGFAVSSQASAQIILPNLPQPIPGPGQKDPFDQLQKALDQAFNQAALQPGLRRDFANRGMNWGGMKLARVDMVMQEQLGLPEREGLSVVDVDANSAADKAGVKANDILVKINNKAVPSDLDSLSKLVKDQKENEPMDLVVLRKGKEETLKGAKMPLAVQGVGAMGRPGIGGMGGRGGAGFGGIGGIGRIQINRGGKPAARNLDMQITVNGEKIVRKEKGDNFFGEYSKDELKITVAGKFENGLAKPSEINVQDGKDTKKYTTLKDVPQQYRPMLQRILPNGAINPLILPIIPNLDFPGLPLPGFDN